MKSPRPSPIRSFPAPVFPHRLWIGILVLCLASASSRAGEAASLDALRARIAAHIGADRFQAAAWGVLIAGAESGRVLFEHDSMKLLKPASNAKLYMGALALDLFGPEHRLATPVCAIQGPDEQGCVRGPVVVRGRGDFSLAARFNGGDYSQSLAPFIAGFQKAGVKKIEGDLIGDDSYFRGAPYGAGWTWDDLNYYYGAEASALTLEDNVVDLVIRPGEKIGAPALWTARPRTDYLDFQNKLATIPQGEGRWARVYRPLASRTVFLYGDMALDGAAWTDAVTVPQPALWFVVQLRAALADAGIDVTGECKAAGWQTPLPDNISSAELVRVESAPMHRLVAMMMKPSQNLYAQLLLLQAGAAAAEKDPALLRAFRPTTEDLGLRELRRFLQKALVPEGEVLLEEGSGLSRAALVTPRATVRLLRFMRTHPHAEWFRAALPVAGVDGTLRSRFKGTEAEGNLRAKTGTLRYVNALSGFVTTAAGEELVFSLMLNNYNPPPGRTGRMELDDLALWLAEWEGTAPGGLDEKGLTRTVPDP